MKKLNKPMNALNMTTNKSSLNKKTSKNKKKQKNKSKKERRKGKKLKFQLNRDKS